MGPVLYESPVVGVGVGVIQIFPLYSGTHVTQNLQIRNIRVGLSVAQWLDHLTGVWGLAIGLTPTENLIFLYPLLLML